MIVPGIQLGLEGYVRIWLGAREEYLREGLRRVGEELKRTRRDTDGRSLTLPSLRRGGQPRDPTLRVAGS